jgi:hypothetical protein
MSHFGSKADKPSRAKIRLSANVQKRTNAGKVGLSALVNSGHRANLFDHLIGAADIWQENQFGLRRSLHCSNAICCVVAGASAASVNSQRQWRFWRSSDSSQLIPASRMRWAISIAMRYRSSASFCCALKSSSGLEGLRTILDDIRKLPFTGGSVG